jgi:hypothetical protein
MKVEDTDGYRINLMAASSSSLSVRELRQELKRLGCDSRECVEKADLVDLLDKARGEALVKKEASSSMPKVLMQHVELIQEQQRFILQLPENERKPSQIRCLKYHALLDQLGVAIATAMPPALDCHAMLAALSFVSQDFHSEIS